MSIFASDNSRKIQHNLLFGKRHFNVLNDRLVGHLREMRVTKKNYSLLFLAHSHWCYLIGTLTLMAWWNLIKRNKIVKSFFFLFSLDFCELFLSVARDLRNFLKLSGQPKLTFFKHFCLSPVAFRNVGM